MAIDSAPAGTSNAELVRSWFALLDAHDIDALSRFWTPESVERFPDRTCVGREDIRGYFEEVLAAVPDLAIEPVSIVGDGDDVFVHWRLTGTHEGRLQGIAGTGRRVAVDGIDHFVVRDGMLVSNFVVSDRLQFAQQVGLAPPDGSPGDRAVKGLFNSRRALLRRLRR